MAGLSALDAAGNAVSDMRANSFTDATSNPANTNAGMFPGFSRWWNSSDYGDNQWMQYRKDALQNPNFQQLQEGDVINFAKMSPAEQEQVYRAMILSQRNRENAAFAKANGKQYSWVNDANNPFNVEGLSDANLAMRLESLAKANQLLPKIDRAWLPASLPQQAVPPGGNSMLGGNPPAPAPASREPDSLAKALQQQLEADAAAERERALALAQIRQQQRILEMLKGSRNTVTGADPARFLSGR